jgi:hypothetical protein
VDQAARDAEAERLAAEQERLRHPEGTPARNDAQAAPPTDDQAAEQAPMAARDEALRNAIQAFSNGFDQTPALRELWVAAKQGCDNSRDGFNLARDRFWTAINKGVDDNALAVRSILEAAGFRLGTERQSPKFSMAYPDPPSPKAAPSEKADPSGSAAPSEKAAPPQDGPKPQKYTYEQVHARMLAESNFAKDRKTPLSEQQLANREDMQLSLDIDHNFPASREAEYQAQVGEQRHAWLDERNLKLMFGDDNRIYKRDLTGEEFVQLMKNRDAERAARRQGH